WAARAAPSLERNSRSAVTRKTRLGKDGLRAHRALLESAASPPNIEEGRFPRDHENRLTDGRRVEAREDEERGRGEIGDRGHAIAAPVPGELVRLASLRRFVTFDEHVVVHLVDARGYRFSRAIERGVERLSVMPREVLLRRRVVRLEGRDVGPPLEVMAELVGQRVPGLAAPIEVAPLEARESRERAVVQHDPGLRSEEHRLNSSHVAISYAVFCLKKKKKLIIILTQF